MWAMKAGKAPAPSAMETEPLIALLEGRAKLFVHCYKTQDMLSVIEISEEYGFNITAFHHAIEAWLLPKVLAEKGIVAATFAQNGLFKMEAARQNPAAPVILAAAGAPFCFKSDHPVLFSRDLIRQMGIAVHHGLPDVNALATVTTVPAKAMGLASTLGQLAPGFDGDLVRTPV